MINEGGWGQVWSFVRAALQPDLSSDILSLALPSTLITLAYAVCGTALSVVIGFVGGILSSSVWWQMVFPGKEGRGVRRHAYVVPWVGVRGLGRLLGDQLASFSYRSVLTSLIFYVGLTFLVDMISAAVRRAVR